MMLQKALDLTDRVLSVRDTLTLNDSDLADEWHRVALLHLDRSFVALEAVRLVSANGLLEPALVLTRHLFELAVNVRYLANDPMVMVPLYLKHSKIPLTPEERDKTAQELEYLWKKWEEGDYAGVSKSLLPNKPWKPLKEMCKDLNCLNHYWTMYRASSEVAHGGAYEIDSTMLELIGYQQRPDWELPKDLLSALTYFGWVAEISRKVFPSLESRIQISSAWGDEIDALKQQIKGHAMGHARSVHGSSDAR
ncbi:MAG: hypothetical protein J4F46_05265 [Dehalococcoidia bacterium]|nr:hypothetical protein [Dehalococcoidia bacterium]